MDSKLRLLGKYKLLIRDATEKENCTSGQRYPIDNVWNLNYFMLSISNFIKLPTIYLEVDNVLASVPRAIPKIGQITHSYWTALTTTNNDQQNKSLYIYVGSSTSMSTLRKVGGSILIGSSTLWPTQHIAIKLSMN